MSRSTKVEKARLLNAAYRLVRRRAELSEAADQLSRERGLSRRQAYRYLAQAATLTEPVAAVERTMAVTFKIPADTVRALRAYARRSGLTLGEIVARALAAFLGAVR